MKHLSDGEFLANTQSGIHLIDVYADSCPPCRMLTPILEKISQTLPDITFWKVDGLTEKGIVKRFQVSSVPHIIVLKDGVKVLEWKGLLREKQILDKLLTIG